MRQYFVPYVGDRPALTVINGHRLVIVSQDRLELQEYLGVLGGDRLEVLRASEDLDDDELLGELAECVDGGVVVAPYDVGLNEVIRNLQSELPWIQ